MIGKEPQELAVKRWDKLHLLQETYPEFVPFCEDMMVELGFSLSEIQGDIAGYMQHGPKSLMVQAQRSQAKTTIAACFAVWCLVHSPAHRVLIVSAGSTQANEISTLIVRLIMTVDILECMRPDKQAGDRTSVEHFDLHHSLKGIDKSPSVACVGITSNLQGKRADLLIADDVESAKNSMTAVLRAVLLQFTRDFTSIVQNGRILWLGTPQSVDSVYNGLPARGVEIRIWPGRYPTPDQRKHYGTHLAPLLATRLDADPSLGTGGGPLRSQGKPIDPVLLDEAALTAKELDQGIEYFQLQHMLSTQLTDAMRYPLKTESCTVFVPGPKFPLAPMRSALSSDRTTFQSCGHAFKMSNMLVESIDYATAQRTWAYVDPAAGGANADETAYAIGAFLNGNVFLLSAGGIPGGYDEAKLGLLAEILARYKLDGVTIEKNMGYGAFSTVFAPILRRHITCQLDDDLVSGQKERRIIETLGPVMGRGALHIADSVMQEDEQRCAIYAAHARQQYSLFFQINKLTRDRGSLVHDDRIDAVEGLVRKFQSIFAIDQDKEIDRLRRKEHAEIMKNPVGYDMGKYGPKPKFGSILRRRR